MTVSSGPPAYPPHYPLGGTFADFLRWHMDYWGTRPTGNTTRNGLIWAKNDFLKAAFGSNWHEDTFRTGLRNWRGAGSAPDENSAPRLMNALFGTNPVFADWRNDFEAAYTASRGRGNNPNTREFPEPPPVPVATKPIPRLTPYFMGRDEECERLVETILTEEAGETAFLVQGAPVWARPN